MPEMATVCQETANTPPNMFGTRGPQGVGPHPYYNHCGYSTPAGHAQYGSDGYVSFQTSPAEQSPHLQHHIHSQQQQHHQQAWGYGMGVGVMGSSRGGVLSDDWTQGYLVPGNNTPTQTTYNYQYRGPTSHGPLEYSGPLHTGHDTEPQGLEGSPSPSSSSPGEPTTGMGPNNQGAKSLRPPYEWMKPTASLPQAGKTRTKDKYRVVYSDHQRLELEKEFHFSKYITIRRKAEIASQLGLSERQVKIWFQNRRAKERKQNKKRDEQVTILPHGGNNVIMSNGQEHPQRLQHSSTREPHQHTFMPKLELEEDKSVLHELTCHNMTHTQGAGLPSHSAPPPSIVLHPSLHHSPTISMPPIIMSRNHSHSSIGRYHENVPTSTISPITTSDDVTYRMASNADTTASNMNLSGSSDSGVLSSH